MTKDDFMKMSKVAIVEYMYSIEPRLNYKTGDEAKAEWAKYCRHNNKKTIWDFARIILDMKKGSNYNV